LLQQFFAIYKKDDCIKNLSQVIMEYYTL